MTHRGNPCTARALRAHCALLLDYVPPSETPLELGDPNWTGGDLEGDLPGSCGMVKDQGPLGRKQVSKRSTHARPGMHMQQCSAVQEIMGMIQLC